MDMLLNAAVLLIPSFIASSLHVCRLSHGDMGKCRKFAVFCIYFILVNISNYSIVYVRGVKRFHLVMQMTISFRLKYMGLGVILGMFFYGAAKILRKTDTIPSGKQQKYTNFDLLKIVAMCMIVLFHYSYKFDFCGLGKYKIVMDAIWMFGELGVNIFALISGYFMIAQEKPFKAKKICLMWLQVLFYSFLSTALGWRAGILGRDQETILRTLFPVTYMAWWYVSAYFGLYFLAPFMNRGLRTLTVKEYRRLIVILLSFFCVWPTCLGIFNNDTESFFWYNRFVWIIILYCVAGYIRIHGLCGNKWTIFHWGGIQIFAWIMVLLFMYFVPENGISDHLKMNNVYFWRPNSFVMLILSVSLLMFFSKLKIKENRIISFVASCTLGIYLGHVDRSDWIWKNVFRQDLWGIEAVLTDMICAFTCILMGTLLIEVVRKQMERIVAMVYDRIWRGN